MKFMIAALAFTLVSNASAVGARKSVTWEATNFLMKHTGPEIVRRDVEGRESLYGIVFEKEYAAPAIARIPMIPTPKGVTWDGKSFKLYAYIFVTGISPYGSIRLDWVGQCTYEDYYNENERYAPWSTIYNPDNWPVMTSNGVMKRNVGTLSQYDITVFETSGDIPLHGCNDDDPNKVRILWIKGYIDTAVTDTPHLSSFLFMKFRADYGVK